MLIDFYIQDPNHKFPGKYLDDDVYVKAIESFIIVSTDVLLVDFERTGSVYLADRKAKPMCGWWFIGGRCFAGERWEESMRRCFKRETSLDFSEERFKLIGIIRYIWSERQQEPQNIGSDNLGYTFVTQITREELEIAKKNLNPKEYGAGGIKEFSLEQLKSQNVHPVIIGLYNNIFLTKN